MRKVLFFTALNWAFGSIHFGLLRRLRAHGIHADILDWYKSYTPEEFQHLHRVYDLFVTTPESLHILCGAQQYQTPLDKIAIVAHHESDLPQARDRMGGLAFIDALAGFAAVHPNIATFSANMGIQRVPTIVTVGVETEMFCGPPAQTLRTLGHVGSHRLVGHDGVDCKRPELMDAVLDGLLFDRDPAPNQHYLVMPSRYWNVDGIVVTSLYESCGLPYLEAAAAGRLVVGTPTGYFEQHHAGLGAVCRMDAAGFVQDARATLLYYRDSPVQYRHRCAEAQAYCRQHFDWDKTIYSWLKVLA